jgi:preprotein translocase subunit SecG
MQTVVIVIHLMVIIALIGVVLMQRSEGGALGIGGSSNFLTTRGQGNVLTKATAILAAAFFVTSITMTVLSRLQSGPSSILDAVPAAPATVPSSNTPAPSAGETGNGNAPGILDELQRSTGSAPEDSTDSTTPAPTTPPATQVPTSE